MSEEQVAEPTDQEILASIEEATDVETVTDESYPEPQEAEPVEPSSDIPEAKQKAIEAGWTEKESYNGDPDAWVDYDEFNRRAPLFERIHSQQKKLKSVESKLNAVIEHNKKLEEKTREKVIAELKQQQRVAVENADTEAYDEAQKQIDEVESQEAESFEAEESGPEIPQVVKDFAARNPWFEKDEKMARYFNATVQDLVSSGKEFSAAIEQAEGEVKEFFSSRLKPGPNPNKAKPAAVMGRSQEARNNKITSIRALPREQQEVFYAMKGSVTEEEFLNQLETIG